MKLLVAFISALLLGCALSKPALTDISFSRIQIDTSRTGNIRLSSTMRTKIEGVFITTLTLNGAVVSNGAQPITVTLTGRSETSVDAAMSVPAKNITVYQRIYVGSFCGSEGDYFAQDLANALVGELVRKCREK